MIIRMDDIIQLRDVALEPVIGLKSNSVVDAGIVELAPISPASRYVPTRQLTDLAILQNAVLGLMGERA